MNPNSLRLLALAMLIFLALMLAPQTRWLVKSQTVPPSLLSGQYEQQKRLFVQSHPDDYQVQLAGQPDAPAQTQLQYARSLVPRFPDNASLRANLLRYASESLHVSRDEDYLIQGQPIPAPSNTPNVPLTSPVELAAFEADAAAGERLDPDNAYFPWMRSVGYFASHRDTEGLAAIKRASEKHVWREYSDDEVTGHWRINDHVYGGREAISSMAVSASLLFPHYQYLRQTARIVTYKAILEEQAGRPEAGLTLRRQIAHCGQLMAVQSTVLIGNLVGSAICFVAHSRPGGSPPIKNDSGLTNDQRAQQRLELYCAYVTRIGHPEDATEAQAQFQEWQQIHQITSKISDRPFGMPTASIVHLTVALVTGWVLFPNIVNLLVLGLAATLLSRLPRFQKQLPLPPGTATGIWGVILMVLALAGAFVSAAPEDFAAFAVLIVLPPLAVAGLGAVFLPDLRGPIFQVLRATLVTAMVLGLYGSVTIWLMHGGVEVIRTLQQTLAFDGSPDGAGSQAQTLLGLAFGLAIPLLLAIILSIVSRVRRVPASVGLVAGFRQWMPPLVCALMFAYGVLILWTVQKEREVNYGLEQSLQGEGQYLAEMTGQTWPK